MLAELSAASVQGRTALGERAGEGDCRPGRGTRNEPFAKGPLCAELDGYSLHAAVRVEGRDRDRLEHLCRYAGRPAIAAERLVELADGRVGYVLKRRWRDGTAAVVMTKQVLMERLCALVPRPRRHLVTYHGVFGPAAGIRQWVVPQVEATGEGGDGEPNAAGGENGEEAAELEPIERRQLVVPHAPRKRRRGPVRRYPWADLLRRVFGTEVLVCPRCGGRRTVLAAIHDPESIRKVLASVGSAEVPGLLAARSPPRQRELEFDG